ncbi:MAG: RnfABCDGE type electron transport complex subunit D [Bacteroidota bacterium]|nr:RnfABCDGE type electron transport complex subunit D [Bacteroidota bacterium]
MMNKLVISQSPHLHEKDSVQKIMYLVIIALVPALALSLYLYGVGALIVTSVSVISAIIFEWLITKYILKKKPTVWDGSAALTGLLLAFNVPSNLPIWIIIIGVIVAIGIGKMSFGGLGQNPFNPAILGRVFLLISFPVQMTSWPLPHQAGKYIDAISGATPLGTLKDGLRNGEVVSQIMEKIPSYWEMFYGIMGGSFGEISAGLLILGGIFLLLKKVISWHIPVSILATVVIFTGIFWKIDPTSYADPLFHLLTGGLILGAFFMATDYVSSPMSNWGKIIFGVGIGALTVIIRFWGAYPEGVSFAILIMNAFVPIIDRAFIYKTL